MKRILTVLLTVVLLVSQLGAMSVFAATVAGNQADPIKAGDTATLYAENFSSYGEPFYTTDGTTDTENTTVKKYVMGYNLKFVFYSAKAQKLKLKIKVAPQKDSEGKTALAFFNPVATPTSKTDGMVEGVDYPAKSEALLNYTFTPWSDYYSYHLNRVEGRKQMKYSNPNDWPAKEFEVDALEGANVLWFPTANNNNFDLYNFANKNVLVYSLTIESLEASDAPVEPEIPEEPEITIEPVEAEGEKGVFYVYDIKNKENFIYGNTIDSYLGAENLKGYTNERVQDPGAYYTIPFSVEEDGDYILNVYYGKFHEKLTYANEARSALYLDQMPSLSPSELKNAYAACSNVVTDTTNLESYNAYLKSLNKDAVTQYPATATAKWWNFRSTSMNDFDFSKKIISANWFATQPLYDNSGATPTGYTGKASYFRVNSFVLKGIKAGNHTATFLIEGFDKDNNGNFGVKVNEGIMINRIELVPSKAGIKPAISTFAYATSPNEMTFSGATRSVWTKHITDIAQLNDSVFGATDLKFGVEVTNPSSLSKAVSYKVILAYYGEDDMLISVDNPEGGSFTVPVKEKTTVRKTFAKAINSIPQGTLKIKAFLWDVGNDLVVAAAKPTVLD